MNAPPLSQHPMLQAIGLSKVFDAIEAAGGEARIVGGAVRNALLDRPVHEIDIATTLEPDATIAAARAAGLKAHPTGIDHGTVTIVSENNTFEVTTLRHDVSTDGRRATVAFTGDWQADAARRDFTMNALYCDRHGNVLDPLDVIDDIFNQKIRFAGDPDARIKEDYLRILRFFRFHAQYGQGTADAAALAACERNVAGLGQLSRERVGQEMSKLLLAGGAGDAAELMNRTGVSSALFGSLLNAARLARVVAIDAANQLAPDYPLRLAAAFDLDPEATGDSLRLSNADTRELSAVLSAMPPSPALREAERKVVLYQTGGGTFARAVRLAWADSAASADDASWRGLLRLPEDWPVPVMPLTGADLVAAGLEPGPQLGATLRRLEDWWVAGGFTATREELLAKVSA